MPYDFNGLKVSRRLIASTAFEYGQGHIFFENPWMWLWIKLRLVDVGYFGAFVSPTITVQERTGFWQKSKPWTAIRIYPHKVENKKGWRNCGIDKLIREKLPFLESAVQRKAIISLGALDSIQEIPSMLRRLALFDIVGIEINASCHNVDLCFLADFNVFRNLCKESRKSSHHPLGVKLNAESDYVRMAKIAQDEGINFLHAINTTLIYSKSLGYCGLSSYKNKPITLKVIADLRRNGITIPIIGGSGIWTMKDVHDYENAGANLFSVSHQFLYFPFWLSILAKMVG